MKRGLLIVMLACATLAQAQTPPAAAPPAPAQLQKKVEDYMRKILAWGPSFLVKVGTPTDAIVPGFYQVTIEVTLGNQSDTGLVYVSKDGRYLLRGELHDTSADPFGAIRSRIQLEGHPSKGPANAQVSVVEYSDFQCPSCRELHTTLGQLKPRYPQVRFVFKDFPLTHIHPWAMTAAIAGRCAYQQSPEAFWKVHDAIFDNQDSINPENAWQKMLDFAAQAGVPPDAFRVCMASPHAKQHVEASVAEGKSLNIGNTPTVFVNGRRLVGGIRALLEQYINYEIAAATPNPQK